MSLIQAGILGAILGRGPKAFLIGKIIDVNPETGKFMLSKFKVDDIFSTDRHSELPLNH